MKIIIGSDHAAYEAKEYVKQLLNHYDVLDVGSSSDERCDYPEFAIKLCKEVLNKKAKGILLCGSGIGVSMVANRFKNIRAALCRDAEEAKLSRLHNDANVLCLGGRISSNEEIKNMVEVWLGTNFEGGRHISRVEMFNNLGEDIN